MLRTAQYKLVRGSHKVYDPKVGACFLETAIIASGFPYRQVSSINDCPPCFSRVLATYTIRLNEGMPDILRQELLLPFVTQLAETADVTSVESERALFMAMRAQAGIPGSGGLIPIPLRAALRLATSDPVTSVAYTVKTIRLAADCGNPRKFWMMATWILRDAIRIRDLRPTEDISSIIGSTTNIKPTALVAAVPDEPCQPDRELEFA